MEEKDIKSKVAELFLKACVVNVTLLRGNLTKLEQKVLEYKKTQYRDEIQFYENLLTEEK